LLQDINVTNTAIANIFEPLAAPLKLKGVDYTTSAFTFDNIWRLYARLYPLMMLDFVHQKDYNTFVKFVKAHKHKVVAHKIALPSGQLAAFHPLTLMILAATVSPEPWSGLPAKNIPGGLLMNPMYNALRTLSKTTLEIDKKKKEYL